MVSIDEHSSLQDRIDAALPLCNLMVEQHNKGTDEDGIEAQNFDLVKKLEECRLMEWQRVQLEHVGTSPWNREKHMLVPVDVQDLLLTFSKKGFNHHIWKAMALTIPNCEEGKAWRQANVRLVERSDGLLPRVNADMLQIVCGRGSHGSAALRAGKFSCRSIHPEIADSHGRVSKNKLVELQPSLNDPFERGCWYQVIPGELELQCPGIFALLSCMGNASNSSFRLQTALQYCCRIHELACQDSNPDWGKIQKIASHGMPDDVSEHIGKFCSFVKSWGGGSQGTVLKALEAYEKTLQLRRKLAPEHLEALAKMEQQMLEFPHFVAVSHLIQIYCYMLFWVVAVMCAMCTISARYICIMLLAARFVQHLICSSERNNIGTRLVLLEFPKHTCDTW
jgi:hypothetical protein